MNPFREFLQQEYIKRSARNKSYSLRAYARQLGFNHATLSSFLSGKRRITPASIQKISKSLNLSSDQVRIFLTSASDNNNRQEKHFHLLSQDIFEMISDWYFDAILELCKIPEINLNSRVVAKVLKIPIVQARLAIQTLERLKLLRKDSAGQYNLQQKDTTNILDSDLTSFAQVEHQKAIIQKSLDALAECPRNKRDHTSTTMAIDPRDIPQAKEMIRKFRNELDTFLQRTGSIPSEVYQLQVSFFPLTNLTKEKSS